MYAFINGCRKGTLNQKESQLYEALQSIKAITDEQLMRNSRLTEHESYFTQYMMQLLVNEFVKTRKIPLDVPTAQSINSLIVNEYFNDYYGRKP